MAPKVALKNELEELLARVSKLEELTARVEAWEKLVKEKDGKIKAFIIYIIYI
jgi:hypothetical protein